MAMTLNTSGAAFARARIAAGDYDASAAWSFSAADGDAMLGSNGDNWANYDRWHLGHDLAQPAATKDRFGYPFGKGGKVYRSALTAIRQRAGQQNVTDILDDAGTLLALIDAKEGGKGLKAAGLQRAYSVLEIKSLNDDLRIITGIATTPSTDRTDDIVMPEGAVFNLPLPLLWQHDSDCPVGSVIDANVSSAGILVTCQFERVDEPPSLKDDLDRAWAMVKAKLVRGLSIGFNPIETAQIEGTWGRRYLKWELLELSAVTIPANADATITTIRSIDTKQRAASGHSVLPVVRLSPTPPGVSGKPAKPEIRPKEGNMTTISEQITSLEASRASKDARLSAIMQKSIDENRTTDASEREEYDTIEQEVAAIDGDLVRLRAREASLAKTARPVERVDNAGNGSAARAPVAVKHTETLAPGIRFARVAKCIGLAKGSMSDALRIAEARYPNDENVINVMKAGLAGASVGDATWAGNLVGEETSVFADFVEFLRPMTILGRFGTGNYPSLRRVPFRVALISQTSGGNGYWVGEGKPKPLTSFAFTRTHLVPLKVANIAVATMEVLRDSSPSAEMILRDQLAKALTERLDIDFIDPAKSSSANVSPASITNGVSPIPSHGNDADAVRADIRSLFSVFIAGNNAPTTGVLVMANTTALALSLMRNALGQREFPDITMLGGMLEGLPVLTSENVVSDSNGSFVTLLNASDIYLADDGGINIDMSREASLQMDDAPTDDSITPTPTTMVSLWQTNSVGFLAERTINWARRRDASVALLSGVNWGLGDPSS